MPGTAEDMKLVVKHTFLEFVDTDSKATGMRARGYTDSECFKSTSSITSDSTSLPSSSPMTAISEEETYACATPSWDVQVEPTTASPSTMQPPPLVLPARQSPTSSQPCGLAVMSPVDASLGAAQVGNWPPGYFYEPMPYAASPMENNPAIDASSPMESRTTIMLRQLPPALGRDDLIYNLNMMGFAGKFDFVYLPVDFSCGKPLGYAFVNLLTPADADQLWASYDGFTQWGNMAFSEACTVTWSDPHQGLEAHIERYRNSPVMHPTVPESWRPAVFKNGQSVPFPHPTRKIKAPKFKHRPQRAEA